ncbi:Alcohol dehydrogenase, C-terminal [Cynara cardunculus var. scolymus]|uniref:Probable quinone oxidoreductase n=1 Tax=Cynara cardunculus var. scolymus TaxID=59895 RepID=A0A103YJ39_CYNCS|nr:Alcohol dehydrogenase, C-terminal [Cynara cardunculus var. scolymus]
MVKAIRVYELGGPEVLKWEDVEIGDPKEGEIRVKNRAIGVNFIDIYFRTGVYKMPEIPYTPGVEAAGVVTAVGPGVTNWKIGDAVYHSGSAMGTYTEEQIVLADKAMPLPPIDPLVVASVMAKGLTAPAGGVGSLLCQWANMLGATVIGTVSTIEKALQAKEDGCHHVIIYKEEDFVTRVDEITSGGGVDVVFDSVGKDTFQGSLACLKPCGYMVSYGQSSGTPDPVPLSVLAAKSLFLTRPSLRTSRISREELREATNEVLTNVASGALRVRVNHTYQLSQAAQAHADLAGRKTSGSIVLVPDGAEK